MNALARLQDRFPNRRAVYVRAVGRTKILQDYGGIRNRDLAMGTRNGRIGKLEIVGETAPDKVIARLELNFPSSRRSWVDYQPGHLSYHSEIEAIVDKNWDNCLLIFSALIISG
jgi:hypothetical protein